MNNADRSGNNRQGHHRSSEMWDSKEIRVTLPCPDL